MYFGCNIGEWTKDFYVIKIIPVVNICTINKQKSIRNLSAQHLYIPAYPRGNCKGLSPKPIFNIYNKLSRMNTKLVVSQITAYIKSSKVTWQRSFSTSRHVATGLLTSTIIYSYKMSVINKVVHKLFVQWFSFYLRWTLVMPAGNVTNTVKSMGHTNEGCT